MTVLSLHLFMFHTIDEDELPENGSFVTYILIATFGHLHLCI